MAVYTGIEAKVADSIAAGFRNGFTHPGDPDTGQPPISIPLPPFRTASMPPEMGEQVDATAKLIAEAIVALITTEATLIDSKELADEHPKPPPDTVMVYCRCHKPLARLHTRDDVATVDAELLIHGLSAHQCDH